MLIGSVMERHFHAVHRIAFRITGTEGDAEEATQEAFLRAWRQPREALRQDAAFSTWIARIAMNTSINWCGDGGGTRCMMLLRIADESGGETEQVTVQVADGAAG